MRHNDRFTAYVFVLIHWCLFSYFTVSVTTTCIVLCQPLSVENYTARFSSLLHLEEIQQEIDIREYDMEHVGICSSLLYF